MTQQSIKPHLIIVSAPSGAGKTTLCSRLLQTFPDIVLSISCTTRAPRKNEREGIHYFFISQKDFETRIQNGEFAEWAKVHDHYYGTSKKTIEDAFRKGKSVLLDIDVQGAEKLRNAFPDRSISIFISPPNLEELERRLRSRGTDTEEVVQKRLKNAQKEMARANEFELQITNDNLNQAFDELKNFIIKKIFS